MSMREGPSLEISYRGSQIGIFYEDDPTLVVAIIHLGQLASVILWAYYKYLANCSRQWEQVLDSFPCPSDILEVPHSKFID